MEKHTVSRLVGSPPGYVGYEEGGQLTEAVRRKPFSVVLFDEIEKAHPDVFNTLLQILEEGRLTDSQGRTVDFRNTVLIMTSNLGTQDLRKANVGFTKVDEAMNYERMKDKVNEALKQHFRPEFLNRIDDIIVFHELSQDEVTQMVDLMIKRLTGQLEGQGLGLELTTAAKQLLAKKGYDPQLGARPLRRAIQRMVEDAVSETDPLQGVPRRRDHRRRCRGRSRQAGRTAAVVPHGRGLPAPRRHRTGRRRPGDHAGVIPGASPHPSVLKGVPRGALRRSSPNTPSRTTRASAGAPLTASAGSPPDDVGFPPLYSRAAPTNTGFAWPTPFRGGFCTCRQGGGGRPVVVGGALARLAGCPGDRRRARRRVGRRRLDLGQPGRR